MFRKQFVALDKSNILNINTGVTQGSILGPLLFIIYTNDIVHVSKYFDSILYADDTSLINTSLNINCEEDVRIINNELNLFIWLSINKLSLNITKTKYMIFKSKNKPNINCSININNIPIERVNNFCFLGIVINEYLTWTDHINKIVNKICRIIELL